MWFSAKEIAVAKLPSMPTSKICVIERATREGWPSRPRRGRGGGREYPIHALPPEAAAALIQREATQAERARTLKYNPIPVRVPPPCLRLPPPKCPTRSGGGLFLPARLFPISPRRRHPGRQARTTSPGHVRATKPSRSWRRGWRCCSVSASLPPTGACRLPAPSVPI